MPVLLDPENALALDVLLAGIDAQGLDWHLSAPDAADLPRIRGIGGAQVPRGKGQYGRVPASAAAISSTPVQRLARNSLKLRSGRCRSNSRSCQAR